MCCCNYVLPEIESTSMKGSIESAVWCIWYRCLVVHGHPTQSNTESTIVGVWAVVPWQWFVTEEPSVGNNHTEESRMTYTPSHNSCTASVILCKHALPHACLLYSHACVSVIVNADKHAFEYFQQDDLHSNTQQLHCICHVVHVRVAHSTSDLIIRSR